MSEASCQYTSWKVNTAALTAEHGDVCLPLIPSETGFASFEAHWQIQMEPAAKIQQGIGGICLYDWRWGVVFGRRRAKDPSAIRRLALPENRKRAEELLLSNRPLKAMLVPAQPSIAYHANLVGWQVATAQRYGVRQMVYHIPRDEYHLYMKRIESLANISIPEAHAKLDSFTDIVEAITREAFTRAGIELKLLKPLSMGAKQDPLASFLYPYLYPERCGIDPESAIGIEDLPEVHLELEARKARQGTIGMALCVLQLPHHPYADICFPTEVEQSIGAGNAPHNVGDVVSMVS
jgi:hypothetical protein